MTPELDTTTAVDVIRWNSLSQSVVNAVAKDFVDGSVILADTAAMPGIQYQLFGDQVSIRIVDENDNRRLISGLPTADFVGGVAFALAREGIIDQQSISSTNIARVCFAIGQLSAQTSQNGAING